MDRARGGNKATRTQQIAVTVRLNPDTNRAEESVLFSEVSSLQRLKCMQEWHLGWKNVEVDKRCRVVSSVQGSIIQGSYCSVNYDHS